jgi:hypothetical protein
VLIAGQGVTTLREHPRYLFGIAFVHLATIGFKIDFRHVLGALCPIMAHLASEEYVEKAV